MKLSLTELEELFQTTEPKKDLSGANQLRMSTVPQKKQEEKVSFYVTGCKDK